MGAGRAVDQILSISCSELVDQEEAARLATRTSGGLWPPSQRFRRTGSRRLKGSATPRNETDWLSPYP